MMTTANQAQLDVTDMVAVHRVFRDVFGAAPALVGGVTDGDADRRALIANFYDNILKFLHVHHAGEDELVFPLLRERCAAQRDLVDRVAGQHRDVDDLLATAERGVAGWAGGGPTTAAEASTALVALGAKLTEHLDAEEQELLPLCAANLSEPEWGALPGHGMQHFEGDKIWLILGLIRQRFTQEQRDHMLAHMPPPAVEMWTGFGENAFNELIAEVGPPLS